MLAQAWERLMRPSLSPFVIAVVIAGPALAQISQEWSRCLNETGTHSFDATIAACTSVISSGKESASLAIAHFNRANAYDGKGDTDRAIADYSKAIDLNPTEPDYYNNRGVAHRAKGDLDRAIGDYGKAIELNSKHAQAYHNRGNAYRFRGAYDLAVNDYARAIEINPKVADFYFNRGLAYRAKG